MPYSTPTQAELDLMYKAYYAGRKSVTHDGKTVVFESSSALWRAIQRYEGDLAGSAAPAKYVRARAGKGL